MDLSLTKNGMSWHLPLPCEFFSAELVDIRPLISEKNHLSHATDFVLRVPVDIIRFLLFLYVSYTYSSRSLDCRSDLPTTLLNDYKREASADSKGSNLSEHV